MRYFAITSDHPRHIKFLETLDSEIELGLIIVVSKPAKDSDLYELEQSFFKTDNSILSRSNILMCDSNQLGSTFVLNTIKNLNPHVGFVFGAPILKKELFEIPSYGCVNIHTGLVEHYRGVDSTMWALKDEEVGLIGSTLHYIDEKIDTGAVIGQRKIQLSLSDTPITLFYKSCQVGFDLLRDNLYNIINNNVKTIKLQNRGKLYQTKDMSPLAMEEIANKTPRLLKEYLIGNNSRLM